MGHYKANVRDLEFNLFEVFGRQEILGKGIYADVDVEAAKDILGEVARLAENELAATTVAHVGGARVEHAPVVVDVPERWVVVMCTRCSRVLGSPHIVRVGA